MDGDDCGVGLSDGRLKELKGADEVKWILEVYRSTTHLRRQLPPGDEGKSNAMQSSLMSELQHVELR